MRSVKLYFIVLISCCLISCSQMVQQELPIYNPSDFNVELVDISLQKKNKNHKVADFELINQNGKTITQEDLSHFNAISGDIYLLPPLTNP